ncbi:MAG TPA: lysophospholipid acyltransferase family protein [Balneolaceae bacterium]|nr:lysophospholipid acyltransferase family protein [Balneolaceae bacterium]
MSTLRAILRLFLLIVYTLTTFGIYLAGYLVVQLINVRYEPWRNLFMRSWARGVAFIFNIQVDAIGEPPKAPFFIVANHMSYLDIVPLYLNLRCTFVAKKEVRSWPVIGFMVKAVGVIFIDRNQRKDVKRVNELLNSSLNEYQGMIVFPEGTSSGGREVLTFHSSLLQLPAAANRPVHYCSLYYETGIGDPPADHSVCFYGARESFTQHIWKFAQTRSIYCEIRFGQEPVKSSDRKELADKLHQKIEEIFRPTTEAETKTEVESVKSS